nr:unnamed protein product [Digitaria exilis]
MAAAGWLRRAAAAAAPRLPSGLPLLPPPPPAPLAEAQSLVVPGLGAGLGPAMELMAVPKKKACLQIQEGLEEWTQSPETCASDCPLQVLRPSEATSLLLLQRRKRNARRIQLINILSSPL